MLQPILELTPPGMVCLARANSSCERGRDETDDGDWLWSLMAW